MRRRAGASHTVAPEHSVRLSHALEGVQVGAEAPTPEIVEDKKRRKGPWNTILGHVNNPFLNTLPIKLLITLLTSVSWHLLKTRTDNLLHPKPAKKVTQGVETTCREAAFVCIVTLSGSFFEALGEKNVSTGHF